MEPTICGLFQEISTLLCVVPDVTASPRIPSMGNQKRCPNCSLACLDFAVPCLWQWLSHVDGCLMRQWEKQVRVLTPRGILIHWSSLWAMPFAKNLIHTPILCGPLIMRKSHWIMVSGCCSIFATWGFKSQKLARFRIGHHCFLFARIHMPLHQT